MDVISGETAEWIAHSKLSDISDEMIIEAVSQQGVDLSLVERFVSSLSTSPHRDVAKRELEKLKEIEFILAVYQELDRWHSDYGKVHRVSNISVEKFVHLYYARNVPVVLTDVASSWRATDLWTPEYFKKEFGNVEVEITAEARSQKSLL